MYLVQLDVSQGLMPKKYFGVVEIVDNQAEYSDWGNGWSIADEKRLAIRDVDADGTLGEFDARAASSVSLLYGGSTISFLRQSNGSFAGGLGDMVARR